MSREEESYNSEIEDVDEILREMGDYENEVEDFAFRIAFALKHKCRNCGRVAHWEEEHRKQGEVLAETARQNMRLRRELKYIADCTKSAVQLPDNLYSAQTVAHLHAVAENALKGGAE